MHQEQIPLAARTAHPRSGPPLNILMVDDRQENLVALEAMLTPLGQNLVCARSGREALQRVLTDDFAVILLDVNMPGMDGFETAALIRNRPKSQHIPIIFLTAVNKSDLHVHTGYSVGAADYLLKPIVPEILKAKVSAFIDLSRKTHELEEEVARREQAEQEIKKLNADLERRVRRRTAELQAANNKLKREIAERQKMEIEREALLEREKLARAEAEEASRSKDEFLAIISHELRTPLTSMLGWAHMLRTGQLDEATRERGLEVLERNARAQAQLIEDLLDVSRIVMKKLKLTLQVVNPVDIVAAALESVQPSAEARGVLLTSDIDPTAGRILADPARLQQIVWNLLTNAIKFTPRDGHVELRLCQRNGAVEIAVEDNGAGISPDILPHIFERFRQADSTAERHHSGLGLGLAIVKEMVSLHNGMVEARSGGEGQGATLIVRLPALENEPGAV